MILLRQIAYYMYMMKCYEIFHEIVMSVTRV